MQSLIEPRGARVRQSLRVAESRKESDKKTGETVLEDAFNNIYTKFKLKLYASIFRRFETQEAALSAVETFCMETIYALKSPSVRAFADFAQISAPNAAYKINSLIRKGYLRKVQNKKDKREFHLEVTEKYLDYYGVSYDYIRVVMNRIRERFSPEDVKTLEKMLNIICDELMPEVPLTRGEHMQ